MAESQESGDATLHNRLHSITLDLMRKWLVRMLKIYGKPLNYSTPAHHPHYNLAPSYVLPNQLFTATRTFLTTYATSFH